MNRLTEILNNGQAAVAGCGSNCKYDFKYCNNYLEDCPTINEIYERLSQYEDIGLTPEQLQKIDKMYTDRYKEIACLKEGIMRTKRKSDVKEKNKESLVKNKDELKTKDDFISRKNMLQHFNDWKTELLQEGNQKECNLLEMIVHGVENEPTAFDLESVIDQIMEESICPYPFNRRFVYLDIVEKILKSETNAMNEAE